MKYSKVDFTRSIYIPGQRATDGVKDVEATPTAGTLDITMGVMVVSIPWCWIIQATRFVAPELVIAEPKKPAPAAPKKAAE